MAKIKLMVEGGKAATTPAMAQTLGPLKIDLKKMLNDINEKTSTFKGMQVPVELNINEKDKSYTIFIKSPPAAELIKNSTKAEKGSGEPERRKVANISVEQLILIAKMKMENLFTNDLKASIKTIAGTCNSMGVLIEGNDSKTFNQLLEDGEYDGIIKSGETEVRIEKIDQLKEQLQAKQSELDKIFAKKAKAAEELKAEMVAAAGPKKETEVAVPAAGEEKKETVAGTSTTVSAEKKPAEKVVEKK